MANKRKIESEAMANQVKLELGENVTLNDANSKPEISLQVEAILTDEPVNLTNVQEQFKQDYNEMIHDFNVAAQQQLTPLQYEQFSVEIERQLALQETEMDEEQEQMTLDIKNRRRKNRRAKGNTE